MNIHDLQQRLRATRIAASPPPRTWAGGTVAPTIRNGRLILPSPPTATDPATVRATETTQPPHTHAGNRASETTQQDDTRARAEGGEAATDGRQGGEADRTAAGGAKGGMVGRPMGRLAAELRRAWEDDKAAGREEGEAF